ncbi:THO2 plays a role in transcriptional elongation [Malassezia vespertilionis]|uniref:THO2 plays a role in transcriptional elongation n=1 Tax=Malassezia vespertilionis TaxID=2020962 RepID=UPI0024B087BD|nr:THO2 plays a role in transcriptional elongation [Malassezia vespertilionis]WFD07414.1 THO2 plays a role in transcriptional elongation [Malassezia vespertilionis]
MQAQDDWLRAAACALEQGSDAEALRTQLESTFTSDARAVQRALIVLLRHAALEPIAPAPDVLASIFTIHTPAFSDVLLDALWAVDWELDARQEVQSARDSDVDDVAWSGERVSLSSARARLAAILVAAVDHGVLDQTTTATRQDVPLLGAAGMVDPSIFQRRAIQIRTGRYFKQQKYNLLREENEGYAALLAQVTAQRGPPIAAELETGASVWYDDARVAEQETDEAREERAVALLGRIAALIGYFRLDAARALDVVLAVFTTHVVHHYPFFLTLLQKSTWKSERIACVLGFQFAHYANQDTREPAPENLYFVAALLVRADLVSLDALMPYLAPAQGLESLKKRHDDALASNSSGAQNALAMAAPLEADGDAEGPTTPAAPAYVPPAQLVHVMRALLACGAIKLVAPIVCQHAWLFAAYPSLMAAYVRIVKYMLQPAYDNIAMHTQAQGTSLGRALPPRLPHACAEQAPTLALTCCVPLPQATLVRRFFFFVDDWARNVVRCNDVDAVVSIALPMLRPVGAQLYQDTELLQILCRFCAAYMHMDLSLWLGVTRAMILPAISLAAPNPALLYALWSILEPLPYTERFRIYGEWKHRVYKRAELRACQKETEREARAILRRVSADNVRNMGRTLAKAAHPNPTVFFAVVLHQIQSYDNLIEPVVDAAKYLTAVEYDILTFSLLEALSNPDKERTKSDGTNLSLWLKSLASFAGAFYKKYASVNCTPLLQYLANRLVKEDTQDLVVLEELIQKMAGIEPIGELSELQIAALTGGFLLQQEAALTFIPKGVSAAPTSVLLARSAYKKGGAQLLRTLAASHLVLPILILIAQRRQACIFQEPDGDAHIKSLGSTFDTCQEILFQYVHFLVSTMPLEDFARRLPPPQDLCKRFAIDAPIAFHITRPKLVYEMRRLEKEEKSRAERKTSSECMDEALPEAEVEVKHSAETLAPNDDAVSEAQAANDNTAREAMDESVDEAAAEPPIETPCWNLALTPVVETMAECLPEGAICALGAPFFVTFWQLSLSDISVPMDRYQQEIARFRTWMREVDAAAELSENIKKSARNRLQDNITQLTAELKEQTLSYQTTRRRLAHESRFFFPADVDKGLLVEQLVAQCLHPRALLSPIDAMFAARFLRLLHTNGTQHLPTLAVYDALFCQHVAQTLFLATENEARSYARFLAAILGDMHAWLRNEAAYNREAISERVCGFALAWEGRRGIRQRDASTPLTWYAFRATVLRWHTSLSDAFIQCLQSDEYMRIRNAIVVLNRVASFFPLYSEHGKALGGAVDSIAQKESRGDLKVLAQGLVATLNKHASAWTALDVFTYVAPKKERKPSPPPKQKQKSSTAKAPKAALERAQPRPKPRKETPKESQAKDERRERHPAKRREEESRREEPVSLRIRGSDTRQEPRYRDRGWGESRRDTHDGQERPSRYSDKETWSSRRDETPRGNAAWNRRRPEEARDSKETARRPEEAQSKEDERSRKRSLADRLGSNESGASAPSSPATDARDTKRARRVERPALQSTDTDRSWNDRERERDPPMRAWGRDKGDAVRDRRGDRDRDRDRRKRRAGGDNA